MGQGTDSCGGYDCEYDPYNDGLALGVWMQKDFSRIKVEDMSINHIKNASRLVDRQILLSTFSDEIEKWESWKEIFEQELARRDNTNKEKSESNGKTRTTKRGLTVCMICHCSKEYHARIADINRGWGLSCSKRCASIRREYGRPAATKKESKTNE